MGASGKVSRTSVGRTLSSFDRAKYCPTLDEYSHDLDTMGSLKKRCKGSAVGTKAICNMETPLWKHRAKGQRQGQRAILKHRYGNTVQRVGSKAAGRLYR